MTAVPPSAYPGQLGIWQNPNLSQEELAIERRFAQQLEADLDYWMQVYQDHNGFVLDTDLARALCAEWDHSDETRARYASAVHNPASAFISTLYHRRLAQPAFPERDLVLFTAGGGSGKTTAVQERLAAILEGAFLIYDTTLAGLNPARDKIKAALATSRTVMIVYVYRPFEDAVRGVLDRALRTGVICRSRCEAHDPERRAPLLNNTPTMPAYKSVSLTIAIPKSAKLSLLRPRKGCAFWTPWRIMR